MGIPAKKVLLATMLISNPLPYPLVHGFFLLDLCNEIHGKISNVNLEVDSRLAVPQMLLIRSLLKRANSFTVYSWVNFITASSVTFLQRSAVIVTTVRVAFCFSDFSQKGPLYRKSLDTLTLLPIPVIFTNMGTGWPFRLCRRCFWPQNKGCILV